MAFFQTRVAMLMVVIAFETLVFSIVIIIAATKGVVLVQTYVCPFLILPMYVIVHVDAVVFLFKVLCD